jgi:hypothetical protein
MRHRPTLLDYRRAPGPAMWLPLRLDSPGVAPTPRLATARQPAPLPGVASRRRATPAAPLAPPPAGISPSDVPAGTADRIAMVVGVAGRTQK